MEDIKSPLLATNGAQKQGFWENWVYLSGTAMLLFVACNIVIGNLAHTRFEAVYYQSTGAWVASVLYFVHLKLVKKSERLILHTPEGQLDWSKVSCYITAATFGTSIFVAINWTFFMCHEVHLNIGIAQTIWGFTPFFSSMLDYFVFGSVLRDNHIAGILCMLAAAVWISLSQAYTEPDDSVSE